MREGDLVLARFPIDGKMYRAKVMAVRKCQFETYFDVLYLDYGNKYLYLDGNDLSAWDPLLEIIQPQGHLCSFLELPEVSDFEESLEAFEALMRSEKEMKMKVHRAYVPAEGTFAGSQSRFGEEVELVVSLTTGQNLNVLTTLQSSLRNSNQPNQLSCNAQTLLFGLETLPGNHLTVPPPLHLQEDVGDLHLEPPLSPVHPTVTARSVEKVNNWQVEFNNSAEAEVRIESLEIIESEFLLF